MYRSMLCSSSDLVSKYVEDALSRYVMPIVISCLSGCASIVGGTTQTISVNTNPPAATCQVNQGIRPVGSVSSTPGGFTVKKTRDDLQLICKKEGYQDSSHIITSDLEPWVFGNVVLGGIIGLGVDWATGAWNRYDEAVNMSLPRT
jgi:hypothetical protein